MSELREEYTELKPRSSGIALPLSSRPDAGCTAYALQACHGVLDQAIRYCIATQSYTIHNKLI